MIVFVLTVSCLLFFERSIANGFLASLGMTTFIARGVSKVFGGKAAKNLTHRLSL